MRSSAAFDSMSRDSDLDSAPSGKPFVNEDVIGCICV